MSALPTAQRETLLKTVALNKSTPTTITSRQALAAELKEAAERGYAITRGENVADVMAVAMPLTLGSETYAIAIAGPLPRIDAALGQRIAQLLAFGGDLSNGS